MFTASYSKYLTNANVSIECWRGVFWHVAVLPEANMQKVNRSSVNWWSRCRGLYATQ